MLNRMPSKELLEFEIGSVGFEAKMLSLRLRRVSGFLCSYHVKQKSLFCVLKTKE